MSEGRVRFRNNVVVKEMIEWKYGKELGVMEVGSTSIRCLIGYRSAIYA